MLQELCYPFDADAIMQKRRRLLRQLKEQQGGVNLRIAVLGGSTTSDIVKMTSPIFCNIIYIQDIINAIDNGYNNKSHRGIFKHLCYWH